MSTHNLSKIFRPQSIAVVGATSKLSSVGRTVLENLQKAGFPGVLYPVNPKYETILDLQTFKSIAELPEAPDLAIIATPAQTVPHLVRECGEKGVHGLIILSAGFREVGPEGAAIEAQLAKEIAKWPEMRVIGPNCLGVLVPKSQLNASFAAAMPRPGRIALISQSGALCTSILDWSLTENIGFSHFVSIGNAVNVKVGDLIDYFAEDPYTDSIVMYVESITEARQFMSAARAFTRTKPIVVYKAGRFAQSAHAAASHTGAMAGVDAVYEAAFRRAGVVRVHEAEDMFDCAELLAHSRSPEGPRLAIVTNAGGPGVMATDELLQRHGELAELTPQTIAELDKILPAHWSRGNPVDVLGDARPERFAQAVDLVLRDPDVDAVLVILTPQAMTDPIATAELLANSTERRRKPVLTAWMGGRSVEPGRQILARAGVATYDSPDRAVRAFTYLVSYKRNRETLYETPRSLSIDKSVNHKLGQRLFNRQLAQGRATLTEVESKSLFAAYGIPTTMPWLAKAAEDAVAVAHDIGYPVVMKVCSPQISHKTEVQGVTTGISNDGDVRRAFVDIVDRARRLRPNATVEGVTIQRMLSTTEGVELIVGAKRDPVFGPVIMLGAGGIAAEVLSDTALELPPLNERLARRMIDSLRIRPLLEGYRGRQSVNKDRLVEVLMRLSHLIADNPAIVELDVNPLLVMPEGATALDGRVTFDLESLTLPPRPYSHLAIRPYPSEYVRSAKLQDGTRVLLRPIQPEDEPMWHELLRRCSARSRWLRFRYTFDETTHEMATRFCFVDYDRTMAIVAEVEVAGELQLIGVGRLVADADHRNAEYAVLVADAWQGRGLGNLLTDYCLKICQTWGVDRVVAETTADNGRMQHIFAKREFERRELAANELRFQIQFEADHDAPLCSSKSRAACLSVKTAGGAVPT